jgi:hypothetical protein
MHLSTPETVRQLDSEVALQEAMSELLFLRGRWLLRSLYRGHNPLFGLEGRNT